MTIQQTKLSELSGNLQQLVERCKGAVRGRNFDYAVEILRRVLREAPGCEEVRRLLHSAQIERVGGEVGAVAKLAAQLKTSLPVGIKGPGLLRKGKLAEALDLAEGAMTADPTAVSTLHFLHRAAFAAGLVDTAAEALELCRRFNPTHEPTLRALIEFYKQRDDLPRALQALKQLVKARANDLGLQRELKELTATAAMEKGRWEDAESFRDVVRDKELARTLEQQEQVAARDSATLEGLIAAARKALDEHESASNHRRLADLYRKQGNYDEALAHYEKVTELSATVDPAVDDAMAETIRERFDDAIRQWREFGQEDPANAAEAEAQIADIEAARDAARVEHFIGRVKRYPNEANYRFELGRLYYEQGDYDAALAQLQAAQRNAQLAPRSLYYAGLCMAEKGLTDMAIEQMETALDRSSERMTRERKEMMYHLALAYAAAGEEDKALKLLKEIYAVDVGFRDVSSLIESHYDTGG